MTDILEALEKLCVVKLDERGRVYIPKAVRERLQMKLGDRIYIKVENDHITIYTAYAIRKRLKHI